MNLLNQSFGFSELSMGMSSDYKKAIEHFDKAIERGFKPEEKYLEALRSYR